MRASRISDHCHATVLHHIERLLDDSATESFRFRCGFISARHADVRRPVRRYLFHLFALLIKRADVFAVKLEHRVNHVRPNRIVLRFPSEKFRIELFRAGSVSRCQLDPAKASWRVFYLCLCSFSHNHFSFKLNSIMTNRLTPAYFIGNQRQ